MLRPSAAKTNDGETRLEEVTSREDDVMIKPRGPVPVGALEWRIREDVPTNLLAVRDAAERLAHFDAGYSSVMAHTWLADLDFGALGAGTLRLRSVFASATSPSALLAFRAQVPRSVELVDLCLLPAACCLPPLLPAEVTSSILVGHRRAPELGRVAVRTVEHRRRSAALPYSCQGVR